MKTLWLKETGEPKTFEPVDAREVMKHSDDYTDVNPNPSDEMPPVPVASVENEFRREPVGADAPEKPRDQPIIRNAIAAPPGAMPPPPHAQHHGKRK